MEDSKKPDTLHEIKSHLTIIKGYMQLIDGVTDSSQKSKEWIAKIMSELEILLKKLEKLKNK